MKVLIVEDEYLVRRGTVATLLEVHPDATVTEATSLKQAFTALETQPDIDLVFLDLRLRPESDGIRTLKEFREWCEGHLLSPRVVVLSSYQDPELVAKVLELDATGFIPKLDVDNARDFGEALSEAVQGRVWIPNPAAGMLGAVRSPAGPLNVAGEYPEYLTDRECEVCDFLLWGLTYKDIARHLPPTAITKEQPTEGTVRRHVNNAAAKLRVTQNCKAGVMAALYILKVKSRVPNPNVKTPKTPLSS